MKSFFRNSLGLSESDILNFSQKWGYLMFWGIALVILGVLALSYSVFATIVSVITLGILLVLAGALVILDSFHFWKTRVSHFFLQFLMGLLYLIVGLMFIFQPMIGSLSLTFMLGVMFVIIGLYRIFGAASFGFPGRGWIIFSGIITLILGIMILAGWPSTGLFIIGLFLGIDFLFLGFNYIFASLALKNLK